MISHRTQGRQAPNLWINFYPKKECLAPNSGRGGGMDAAVSIVIRQWRIDGVCHRQAGRDAAVSIALRRRRREGLLQSKSPMSKSGMDAGF
jgi:hypothetical protein